MSDAPYQKQYDNVAAMISIPAEMKTASTDDLNSLMELKKRKFENMEREILQGSAMESEAPGP
jgi:hypothetical protein